MTSGNVTPVMSCVENRWHRTRLRHGRRPRIAAGSGRRARHAPVSSVRRRGRVRRRAKGSYMALDIGRRRWSGRSGRPGSEGRPPPRVVIVGGGLSGLAMAIQLVRAGLRRLHHHRAVGRGRRHLAGQHLSGERLRRPLPPLLLLLRPTSDWTRRFADQPEILDLRRAAGRALRPRPPPPPRHHGATGSRCDEAAARWRLDLDLAGGRPRCSRPTPWSSPAGSSTGPTSPTSRASTGSPGRPGTRPAGTTRRPRRQAGGRGGHRGQRHPVRAPGGRGGGRRHHLPADPQLRRPEEGPGLPAVDPAAAGPGGTAGPGLPVVDLLEPRVPLDLVPQGQLGRRAAPAAVRQGDPGRGGLRSAARGRGGPRLPHRLQAHPHLQRLVPGHHAAQRRGGRPAHRPHRGRTPW